MIVDKATPELFAALGLRFIPPELREGLGEIEVAERADFPRLVEALDLRGAFHNHTTASDGRNTLVEMVAAAEKLGWEYLGLADHPALVAVESYGTSHEGRNLWLVTVTDGATGPHDAKPAHWVDANIHATEVTGSAAALYLIDHLVTGHANGDPVVTDEPMLEL